MNVDYFAIGQRIKQVRRDRGMTQERLAEALSVSVGYISQIERGVTKISLETLAAVAGCLACDLSELATGVAVTQEHYLDRELAQLAADRGIRLSFLTDYQRTEGAAPPHTLIVNYPALDPEQMAQGLEELAALLG